MHIHSPCGINMKTATDIVFISMDCETVSCNIPLHDLYYIVRQVRLIITKLTQVIMIANTRLVESHSCRRGNYITSLNKING